MIVNTAPSNEAVLSNVGQIGEFRIRQSAKAFNILSSGLYGHKIRAIIRELSTNARDSHIFAGKRDLPFDVHLPNTLEPWFAVRDYGTGLSHDEVTNIYTTYFESTKTDSNDFNGCLGLGSKSFFAYTDNASITAIKDGKKGIYTAFINEIGVPSIALMMQEDTDEPAGVEVKFSVNDRYDFSKFQQEARNVYKWFDLRPVIAGAADFKFEDPQYTDKDIIPGVHSTTSGSSLAIMGNVAYPIDVPQSDNTLGDLRSLLGCGLVINFNIGDIDFQPSREGLSYVPQTLNAIKAKLEAVNGVLAGKLATDADKIVNLWDRAIFLIQKKESNLWRTAVQKYVADTKFELIGTDRYCNIVNPSIKVEDIASKYNIVVRAFEKGRNSLATSSIKPSREYVRTGPAASTSFEVMHFSVTNDTYFVINDTKVGASERAKYHWRQKKIDPKTYRELVYVIEPADKKKPVNTKAFFKAIFNPPTTRILNASSLIEKERKTGGSVAKNVTILSLQEKGYGGYYKQRELVWRDAGKADSFDKSKTHYYLPLVGYHFVSANGYGEDIKELNSDLLDSGIKALQIDTLYGVRKGDLEFIKRQKNWVNLEEYITSVLSNLSADNILGLVVSNLDENVMTQYNNAIQSLVDPKSPFAVLNAHFKGAKRVRHDSRRLDRLFKVYAPKVNFSTNAVISKYKDEIKAIETRYPLLPCIRINNTAAVAEYINLVDKDKGI